MPLLVLALNPSIDVEWRVAGLRWEEKNEVLSERRWPGGKGVNVARWLKHLGGQPRLLLPLGGRTGVELAAGLRAERIPVRVIPLRKPTRANVIVTAPGQGQLRFNPAGPRLAPADWQRVLHETARELKRAPVLVLSGSLPRGLPAGAYAALIRLARAAGVKTLLDCDGSPFALAVKARPFLVKPNQHELAQWSGRRLASLAAIQKAARDLSDVTRGWVLVSLGAQGAMLVNRREEICLSARPRKLQPRNTVGAGDALLAAVTLEIARGSTPAEWLRHGLTAARALTQCAAGVLPRAKEEGRGAR
jgi:1-phosphofructokinase family hexose kinase